MSEAETVELYQRYGYLVYRRCLALTQQRADAEDAMQEVFVRAQRYPRKDQGPSPLAWLYAIADHCCFDLAKKRSRFEPTPHEELPEPAAQREGMRDEPDRRAALLLLLRRLDATTREMGLLHHLGGLTQEEVAAHTGYSRRTVGKKLQRFDELLGDDEKGGGR